MALGTPVLVFAALGYIFRHITKGWGWGWGKGKGKGRKDNGEDSDVEAGRTTVSGDENGDDENGDDGNGDDGNGDTDEEKLGSWAERWVTWAPDQRVRERSEPDLDQVRTIRSPDLSEMEFASRAYVPFLPYTLMHACRCD